MISQVADEFSGRGIIAFRSYDEQISRVVAQQPGAGGGKTAHGQPWFARMRGKMEGEVLAAAIRKRNLPKELVFINFGQFDPWRQ